MLRTQLYTYVLGARHICLGSLSQYQRHLGENRARPLHIHMEAVASQGSLGASSAKALRTD